MYVHSGEKSYMREATSLPISVREHMLHALCYNMIWVEVKETRHMSYTFCPHPLYISSALGFRFNYLLNTT